MFQDQGVEVFDRRRRKLLVIKDTDWRILGLEPRAERLIGWKVAGTDHLRNFETATQLRFIQYPQTHHLERRSSGDDG